MEDLNEGSHPHSVIDPRTGVSALLGNLFKMQSLEPHTQSAESEIWRVEPNNLSFISCPPHPFQIKSGCMPKSENH